MKMYFNSVLLSLFIFNFSCRANGLEIKDVSEHIVDLYKKKAANAENIPEGDRLEVLSHIVSHYLINSPAGIEKEHPIKFIHTIISLLYPHLNTIINKENWEELTGQEVKALAIISYNLLKKIIIIFPADYKLLNSTSKLTARANILKKLRTYALESSIEYLSRLLENHERAIAKAFIARYYLEDVMLFDDLIDMFLELKGHRFAQTKDWTANVFGLEQILTSLNESHPSTFLKNMIEKLMDSVLKLK